MGVETALPFSPRSSLLAFRLSFGLCGFECSERNDVIRC
jgi:hypothetical protein